MDYKTKYEQLRKFILDLYPHLSYYCKEKVEGFIPELQEQKDERIRETFIEYVKSWQQGCCKWNSDKDFCNDAIAWLEKQGKQDKEYLYDVIVVLWDLLDKIDTVSELKIDDTDADNPFRKIMHITQERHKFVKSDGYNLFIDDVKITNRKGLEEQSDCVIDCPQNHQDSNRPNGGIVSEDFTDGEGFYKLNLAYLNKKQVEDVEEMVRLWNIESDTTDDDIKDCIGMCLTDADEQRFKNYNTNLRDCLAWLDRQGEQKSVTKIVQNNNEESNEGNVLIDGLYYAQNILEKTLGKVDGYQTDDGILEHKSAINAVKKLCEMKTTDNDEKRNVINYIRRETCCGFMDANSALMKLIKVLKARPIYIMDKPQRLKIEWEE